MSPVAVFYLFIGCILGLFSWLKADEQKGYNALSTLLIVAFWPGWLVLSIWIGLGKTDDSES